MHALKLYIATEQLFYRLYYILHALNQSTTSILIQANNDSVVCV